MILQLLAVATVCAAVGALVAAERAGRRASAVAAKTAASLAFVLLALLRADLSRPYDRWVVLALALSLAGDLLLAAPNGLAAGLASFALAHVGYTLAFATLVAPRDWAWPVGGALAVAGGCAAAWLWPYLGRLRAAVVGYIVVISAMVWGAVSVSARAGWLVPAAGALFYASDLAVARDRFVVRRFASRSWGLPAYYAAQVLFAVTLGGWGAGRG